MCSAFYAKLARYSGGQILFSKRCGFSSHILKLIWGHHYEQIRLTTTDMLTRPAIPVGKCGAARTIELLGDKWMLLIVREAFFGVFRYDDILNDLGIPRSVLTQRLKRLVELQVLERKPYQEAGARMRNGYVLTEKGRDLGLTLLALMQWSDAHIEGHKPALDVYNKTDQKSWSLPL